MNKLYAQKSTAGVVILLLLSLWMGEASASFAQQGINKINSMKQMGLDIAKAWLALVLLGYIFSFLILRPQHRIALFATIAGVLIGAFSHAMSWLLPMF